jgi:hypothetical protein
MPAIGCASQEPRAPGEEGVARTSAGSRDRPYSLRLTSRASRASLRRLRDRAPWPPLPRLQSSPYRRPALQALRFGSRLRRPGHASRSTACSRRASGSAWMTSLRAASPYGLSARGNSTMSSALQSRWRRCRRRRRRAQRARDAACRPQPATLSGVAGCHFGFDRSCVRTGPYCWGAADRTDLSTRK